MAGDECGDAQHNGRHGRRLVPKLPFMSIDARRKDSPAKPASVFSCLFQAFPVLRAVEMGVTVSQSACNTNSHPLVSDVPGEVETHQNDGRK